MHTWIEISRAVIQENYRFFCRLSHSVIFVPVMKSNAYGHGLKEVYECLKPLNPPWLCVNYLFEALLLRENGYSRNILIVGPCFLEDLEIAYELRADLTISHFAMLNAWKNSSKKCRIHLKFDTGLSRQGFSSEDIPKVQEVLEKKREYLIGVCSHFANVEDETNQSYAKQQWKYFQSIIHQFVPFKPSIIRHISASAATLIMPEVHADFCRIGISLYGEWPSTKAEISYKQKAYSPVDLKPVLSWRTKIAALKSIKKGAYVGYGCTFCSPEDKTLAILPVGYYEGYPRICSNSNSYVLIRSQRCPVIGCISMNMISVDVSRLKDIRVGDIVTLIGQDKDKRITPSILAGWAKSIHYEVLTNLNQMIPRYLI